MYYLIPLSFAFSNYIPSYNYIYLCQLLMSVLLIIVMLLFCFVLKWGSLYIVLSVQELTIQTRLARNSQRSNCLSLPRKACASTSGLSYLFYIFSPYILLTQKATLLDCLDGKQASQNKYVKRGILNPPIIPNLLAVHSSLFQPQQCYFTSKILSNPNYIPSKYI